MKTLMALVALPMLVAQTATFEPRIVSETLPSGGLMQIKFDLTSPHPITSGGPRFSMDADAFDSVEGVSIFSPGGDAYGVAVIRNQKFTGYFVSPLASLGTLLDYPYLVVATRIKPGLPTGRVIPINFDPGTFFLDESGNPYPLALAKSGSLTIGGSVSVTNVIPGGGQLPAGTIVRLLGTGFTPDTRVTINEVATTEAYVSPTEFALTLKTAANLTGKLIKVRNPDNSDVSYFSYLRAVPIGTSTRGLLNSIHPVHSSKTWTSAALTLPAAPVNGFIAVALENEGLTTSDVHLELYSSSGVKLGQTDLNMPQWTRISRTVSELFSQDPGPNGSVRITATQPVKILGVSGDDINGTATAFAAGPLNTTAQIAATPSPMAFSYTVGSTAPGPQTLNVSSTGGSLTFNATSNASWLNVTQNGSQTPATVTVTVNPAGLGSGLQSANITLTPNGAAPLVVPVTFAITAAGTVPGIPGNSYPSPGLTSVPLSGSLAWAAASNATSYDVYLGPVSSPLLLTTTTALSTPFVNLLPNQTYFWQVVAKNSFGSTTSPIWQFTTGAATGSPFIPVTPCRLIDTRIAGAGSPIVAGLTTRTFDLKSHPCLAGADPLAYSLNITVVPSGPLGYLTAWPAGQNQPLVSTLNSLDGRVKANAAIVPAGANRAISVFVTNDTHVIIDINGYFGAPGTVNGLAFYPLPPCRISDTRNPTGSLGGPALVPQQIRTLPVLTSACNIPPAAQAYSLNSTVIPKLPVFSFLTVWPGGQAQPVVSTLNAVTGTITANAAIVPAGTGGTISVYATDAADLILDINGYFAPPGQPGALNFNPEGPCRILDTRITPNGPGAGPALPPGLSRDVPVPLCGSGVNRARAYALNATVVPQEPQFGYLTLWPAGSALPLASTLNALDGAITSNAAIVPTNTPGGNVSIFGSNLVHLILDVNGYFAP
jgi:hypothetical protein